MSFKHRITDIKECIREDTIQTTKFLWFLYSYPRHFQLNESSSTWLWWTISSRNKNKQWKEDIRRSMYYRCNSLGIFSVKSILKIRKKSWTMSSFEFPVKEKVSLHDSLQSLSKFKASTNLVSWQDNGRIYSMKLIYDWISTREYIYLSSCRTLNCIMCTRVKVFRVHWTTQTKQTSTLEIRKQWPNIEKDNGKR